MIQYFKQIYSHRKSYLRMLNSWGANSMSADNRVIKMITLFVEDDREYEGRKL